MSINSLLQKAYDLAISVASPSALARYYEKGVQMIFVDDFVQPIFFWESMRSLGMHISVKQIL